MALKLKPSKNTREKEWYNKYRWFYTSEKKLVVGGKNAEQNEELIKKFLNTNPKYIVMHTKHPGSPFSIILSNTPSEKDLEETAVFTGSFSRAWREGKKKSQIDTFLIEQIIKKKSMKTGTFGVIEEIDRKDVDLRLYLIPQEGKLRAIPFQVKNAICISPGKVNKDKFAEQIAVKLEIPLEEVLQALPTGGFKIIK